MKAYFMAIFCLSLMLGYGSLARADGGEISGGGGDAALEMQKAATEAWREIREMPAEQFPELQGIELESVIQGASVLEVDFALFAEKDAFRQESVALNYPVKKVILVNRARWLQITDRDIRKALALHEFLSLVGIESTGQYPVSSRYVGLSGRVLDQQIFSDPAQFDLDLKWLGSKRIMPRGEWQSCEDAGREAATRLKNAQEELGIPSGTLKARAFLHTIMIGPSQFRRPARQCDLRFSSFDPKVTFGEFETRVKKFLGKEKAQTACVAEYEALSSKPDVVWLQYRSGFSVLRGFWCNVDLIKVVQDY